MSTFTPSTSIRNTLDTANANSSNQINFISSVIDDFHTLYTNNGYQNYEIAQLTMGLLGDNAFNSSLPVDYPLLSDFSIVNAPGGMDGFQNFPDRSGILTFPDNNAGDGAIFNISPLDVQTTGVGSQLQSFTNVGIRHYMNQAQAMKGVTDYFQGLISIAENGNSVPKAFNQTGSYKLGSSGPIKFSDFRGFRKFASPGALPGSDNDNIAEELNSIGKIQIGTHSTTN